MPCLDTVFVPWYNYRELNPFFATDGKVDHHKGTKNVSERNFADRLGAFDKALVKCALFAVLGIKWREKHEKSRYHYG